MNGHAITNGNGGTPLNLNHHRSSNGNSNLPPAPLGTVLFDNQVVESADEDLDDEDDLDGGGDDGGLMGMSASVDGLGGGGVNGVEYEVREDGEGAAAVGSLVDRGANDPIYFLVR